MPVNNTVVYVDVYTFTIYRHMTRACVFIISQLRGYGYSRQQKHVGAQNYPSGVVGNKSIVQQTISRNVNDIKLGSCAGLGWCEETRSRYLFVQSVHSLLFLVIQYQHYRRANIWYQKHTSSSKSKTEKQIVFLKEIYCAESTYSMHKDKLQNCALNQFE